MIWHIAKRELYENLNSLRFGLTTLLLLALMLTNAIVYLREHPKREQNYHDAVTNARNTLTARADNLYVLAQKGPGDFHKKPSSLQFCAEGGEAFLPDVVRTINWWANDTLKSFWRLAYPSLQPNLGNIRPEVTKVDWGFTIGYVLSLIALLFTFDAIAGERESGTLRLMLANAIPRHIVLLGKFFGALISVLIPFAVAGLMNLLVISAPRSVQLAPGEWGRLGIISLIALLYTCIFLALGLLVSARVQRSAVSLVILLLTWVTFVVFMPNTLASIAGGISSPMSSAEFRERRSQLEEALEERFKNQYGRGFKYKKHTELSHEMQAQGEYVMKDAQQQERLNQERLAEQIAQVQRARNITRISPVAIVQHLMETFAGTGFERHLQFLENVRAHARQFREFVIEEDRHDPGSLHVIGVPTGMSQKKVEPGAIPRFEDTLSLSHDFNTAAMDLLLLVLFFIVLMSGAYLAFVRVEI